MGLFKVFMLSKPQFIVLQDDTSIIMHDSELKTEILGLFYVYVWRRLFLSSTR